MEMDSVIAHIVLYIAVKNKAPLGPYSFLAGRRDTPADSPADTPAETDRQILIQAGYIHTYLPGART